MSTPKVVGYARVSTDGQDVSAQVTSIKEYCQRQGWPEPVIKTETESSGKTRPVKKELMDAIRRGEYDTLVFTALDRWARSLSELIRDFAELKTRKITVIPIHAPFRLEPDKNSPTDDLMFHILGSFAEFERALIRSRTIEGLKEARRKGKVLGRPRKSAIRSEIRELTKKLGPDNDKPEQEDGPREPEVVYQEKT
jgi:DNA invertase Pin-like site-specific DNA recombinase